MNPRLTNLVNLKEANPLNVLFGGDGRVQCNLVNLFLTN